MDMKRSLTSVARHAAGLAVLVCLSATPQSYAGAPVATGEALPVPEVTVTAPRLPTPEELAGDSVSNFVAAHARPSLASGHLARWRTPVCASTRGLSAAFTAFISARIAAVAASVGAPYGVTGCKPNIHIYFTTEPQALATSIAKKYPSLLGFHYAHQTESLATIRHPIEGWYETATVGAYGSALDEAMPLNSSADAGTTTAGKLHSTTPSGSLGSFLTDGRSSVLAHVLVIVDSRRVSGYQIGSISDYLAMLVLSQTRQQDACGRLPSILDLWAPTCDRERPTAVTAGDLAFLRALYATTGQNAPYYMEKASIDGRVRRELTPH
jgi:hypothetical protein